MPSKTDTSNTDPADQEGKIKLANPGSKITVKVGGRTYKTIVDSYGVQRFPQNAVLDYMFYHDHAGKHVDDMDCKTQRMLDLNALAVAYAQGKFSQRAYAEFMMGLGYSVCGFSELSAFQDWEIENPLWDKGE